MAVKLRIRQNKKFNTYFLDINKSGARWTETLDIPKDISESERKRVAEIIRAQREKDIFYTGYGLNKPVIRNFITFFEDYAYNYKKASFKKVRHSY